MHQRGFHIWRQAFLAGLGSKVLLANRLSGLWQAAGGIGYESISTPLAWMAAAAFSFQIYFDFYGYSLMAIGLGKMFGFELPDNFRHPYISKSMTEFWRRWHITLGAWFRDYVYIPLGGNRKGIGRTYLNLFIVWTLTGFWHGASWNFILWGMFLFAVIAVEKSGLLKILETHRVIGHIAVFFKSYGTGIAYEQCVFKISVRSLLKFRSCKTCIAVIFAESRFDRIGPEALL